MTLRPIIIIYAIIDGNKYYPNIKSIDIDENRQGINGICEIKYNALFKIGDKISILLDYDNDDDDLCQSLYPLMVITDIQYDNMKTLKFKFIDEFQYYCQTTNFIPVNLNSNDSVSIAQKDFLISFCGYDPISNSYSTNSGDTNAINMSTLLGYINSLIVPKMEIYQNIYPNGIKNILFDKNGLFNLTYLEDFSIGKWSVQSFVSVSEVLKKINTNYFIDLFMTSSSINIPDSIYKEIPETTYFIHEPGTIGNEPLFIDENGIPVYDIVTLAGASNEATNNIDKVTVVALNSVYLNNSDKIFSFEDYFNIINDNLVYQDVNQNLTKVIRGVFVNSKAKKVYTSTPGNTYITDQIQKIYAYFDKNGKAKITYNESDLLNLRTELQINESKKVNQDNTYENWIVNSAQEITKEQREKQVLNKLTKSSYTGFIGGLKTLNFNLNVYDKINIKKYLPNNSNITEGFTYKNNDLNEFLLDSYFAITSIKRTYDQSGLFMNINLRQQLRFDDINNNYKNYND